MHLSFPSTLNSSVIIPVKAPEQVTLIPKADKSTTKKQSHMYVCATPGFLAHRRRDKVQGIQGPTLFAFLLVEGRVHRGKNARCTSRAGPSLSTGPFLVPTIHSTGTKPRKTNEHLPCTPPSGLPGLTAPPQACTHTGSRRLFSGTALT